MRQHFRGLVLVWILPISVPAALAQTPGNTKDKPTAWTTAVAPKPLSPAVTKGLGWLVEHQLKDGGWGQGDESANMGNTGAALRDRANVADTAIAALALIRSGSTPSAGPYKDAIAHAVQFVEAQVESADTQSLDVSAVKGTRVQAKLGPNIDTFLAALFLAEARGGMASPAANQTLDVALNTVLGKIKAHQKADGTWDNRTGWAPILAQSMAGKGINRAYQNNARVDETLLARTENFANAQFAMGASPAKLATIPAVDRAMTIDPTPVAAPEPAPADAVGTLRSGDGYKLAATTRSGGFAGGGAGVGGGGFAGGGSGMGGGMGSAGVELYDRSSSLAVLTDSVNSNKPLEAKARSVIASSKDAKEVAAAQEQIKRFDATKAASSEAQAAVVRRLDDKSFLAGFGSNGGEEFLSYMNIGESLVQKGGDEWRKWDESMTANLNRIQNDDGSWTGHHCITGRNFCTATALLVLLSDRTPVPVASKDQEQDKAKPVVP